jgi:hypothetical protein
MFGIASTELALAYLLSIGAGLLCLIYGIVKYNDSGPMTEELREASRGNEEA